MENWDVLDQHLTNQAAQESEYYFEENGFTKEDLEYEAEMRQRYWSEYMADWAWCSAYYDSDSGYSPPPQKGLFDIDSERIVM